MDILVEESGIKFYVNEESLKNLSSKVPVFYNPRMKINRDLTISFLKTLNKKLKILDGMAGSGIRSLRFLKELSNLEELWINDISKSAIDYIKKNLEINKDLVKNREVKIVNEDINSIYFKYGEKFDYVDLDPFGSPAPFLENTLRLVKNKGYIGVTSTDLSSLTGSKPRALLRKYGIFGIKTDFFREFGIRALIAFSILVGARLDLALIPKFSYYKEHHYRVIFQVLYGKNRVNKILKDLAFIYYNDNTLERDILRLDLNIKKEGKILGPIYIGKLGDKNTIEDMIRISYEYKEFLELILKELKYERPWYVNLRFFAKKYKIGNLKKLSYYLKILDGSRTHFDPLGIKTDLDFQDIVKSLIASK